MSFKKFAGVMAILLACGFVCSTATAGNFADGDRELGLNFAFVNADDGFNDIDIILLDTRVGWFLTDNHEVGGTITYADFDVQDFGTAGVFYDYNFNTSSNITPMLGASAAFVFGDADEVFDYCYKVMGGFRLMPGDNASINFNAFFQTMVGSDNNEDLDLLGLQVGLSMKF